MAHLYKKVKKGHEYYYIRETQRVYGKPTTINQVYLGTADKVETLLGRGGFSPKEFGSVFALNELDKDMDLAGIVNEILPPKKRTKGPSLGELVFYAALNRAIAPTSKRQLATWYETTDIQRIRPLRLESLNSQNFWNHWDRISENDLERIAVSFFRKVNTLLPKGDRQLVIEATRLQSAPKAPGTLDEELGGEEFARQAQQQPGIGLGLVTEREKGVPLYYQTFSSNFSEEKFFELGLDDLLDRVNNLGVPVKDITLLFHRGLDSEPLVNRLNSQEGLHFAASCPSDFAPELTKISLKEFSPLPCRANQRLSNLDGENDKVLFYETRGDFWGRSRRVIVIFDPKTFHKTYQDLGKKVQKVRKELAALQQRYLEETTGADAAQAIKNHLAQLCGRLKLSPDLFQLSFHRENGQLNLSLQLNHRQMASNVRHFGKNILVTDREDWEAAEIFEMFTKRGGVEPQRPSKASSQWSDNTQDSANAIHVTLMPLYHWTGSKIRVHLFVCVVAMTYLALLSQRLNANGFSITPREAMDELRAMRTAIFQESEDGKLKRMLDKVSDRQTAILKAMGYQVQDGKVLPL
jgi:transposase